MTSVGSAQTKQRQYEAAITDYASRQGGRFLVLSDDSAFTGLMRGLLKRLGVEQSGRLAIVSNPALLLGEVEAVFELCEVPVLLMEYSIGGRELSFLVRQFKEDRPELKIIVLTTGMNRERLMLLHEVGADNFIAKPVSENMLVEKLAFTLKPQTEVGRMVDQARNMLRQGLAEECLGLCRQIVGRRANCAPAYLVMGDAFQALHNDAAAREAYERASQYADLFLEPLSRLAELCGRTGDQKGQLAYLRRLDSLSPLNVDRKVELGRIHLDMGQHEKAESFFQAAMELITRESMVLLSVVATRIANVCADACPTLAEKFYRTGLECKGRFLSVEDVVLFNQLGMCLRRQGKWEEAAAEYRKALRVAPDDPVLYYNMALALAEGHRFTEARQHMVKSLELNPQFARGGVEVAYNMGVVFSQAGARERAALCLRAVLDLDPGHGEARRLLGRIQQGDKA